MRPMCINYHVKKSCPNGASCYYVHDEPLDGMEDREEDREEDNSPSKRVKEPALIEEVGP